LVTGEYWHLYDHAQVFLNRFSLQVLGDPHPSGGPTGVTTAFTVHPVTDGLNYLSYGGPAPLGLLGTHPKAAIVGTFPYEGNDLGLIGVYDGTIIPEPTTLALLSLSLAGLVGGRWRRSRGRRDAGGHPPARGQ